jgi:hypothetical protein
LKQTAQQYCTTPSATKALSLLLKLKDFVVYLITTTSLKNGVFFKELSLVDITLSKSEQNFNKVTRFIIGVTKFELL